MRRSISFARTSRRAPIRPAAIRGQSVEGRDLIFELDPHTNSGIRLYLYAANYGYAGFVPPGDEVSLAFFTLTPAELRALAVPHAITGRALGSEFALDQGQLGAIREFVQRTVR